MSQLDSELEKLAEMKQEAEKAAERVKSQQRYIAREFAPVSVGDEVEVNGIRHAGKRMQVSDVRFLGVNMKGRAVFRANGFILKADGNAGKQTANSLYYEDGSQGPSVFV